MPPQPETGPLSTLWRADALRLAEGEGVWRGLYAHDRLDDFQHSRRLLLQVSVLNMISTEIGFSHTETKIAIDCIDGVYRICAG